jgi:two-component system sensor histidine kinase TtrS
MRALFVLLVFFSVLIGEAHSAAPDKPVVRIALIDTFDPDFYLKTYVPTVEYLQKRLPQYRIQVEEIDTEKVSEELERKKPDFVISSAGEYVTLIEKMGAHQIVTKLRKGAPDVAHSVASAVLVRSDRTDINSVADLEGKTVAATDENDFDGWLIFQSLIAQSGKDPEKFFSRVLFTKYNYPDPVTYLKVGQADAAVLSACLYEDMVKTGQLAAQDVRILNPLSTQEPCARSTDLYPDAVFFSLPTASPLMVKNVTMALLSVPESGDFQWIPSNSFLEVHQLLKELKLGPYEHLRDTTLKAFLLEHQRDLYLLAALIAAFLFHLIVLNRLVYVRTEELKKVLAEQHRAEKEAAENRKKLDILERSCALAQMCTIFAHEVKQPLTNMTYYVSGLKLLLERLGIASPVVFETVRKLGEQTRRTVSIVEHVQGYAKKGPRKPEIRDLADTVRSAVKSLEEGEKNSAVIHTDFDRGYLVKVDAFEIELVVLNLIKNALRAVKDTADAEVSVSIRNEAETVTLVIEDNGPAIDEAVFEKLGKSVLNSQTGGLGIGLLIVHSIVESHGGHMIFERRTGGGLRVKVVLTRCREESV